MRERALFARLANAAAAVGKNSKRSHCCCRRRADYVRGKRLFFSAIVLSSKCHFYLVHCSFGLHKSHFHSQIAFICRLHVFSPLIRSYRTAPFCCVYRGRASRRLSSRASARNNTNNQRYQKSIAASATNEKLRTDARARVLSQDGRRTIGSNLGAGSNAAGTSAGRCVSLVVSDVGQGPRHYWRLSVALVWSLGSAQL